MKKTLDRENTTGFDKICVDLEGLCEILSCGKQTAREVADKAQANFYVGRRTLYCVEKVKAYVMLESV